MLSYEIKESTSFLRETKVTQVTTVVEDQTQHKIVLPSIKVIQTSIMLSRK